MIDDGMNEVRELEQEIRIALKKHKKPLELVRNGEAIMAGKPTPGLTGTRLDRLRKIVAEFKALKK